MGFGVWGWGFVVWGLRVGVWGLGFRVRFFGFGVWVFGFGIWGGPLDRLPDQLLVVADQHLIAPGHGQKFQIHVWFN